MEPVICKLLQVLFPPIEATMPRILYIATRRKSAQLRDLFASMRDDMASAAVELVVDRRYQDRRARSDDVSAERRQADRRKYREAPELAQNGWARLPLEDD